MGHESAVGMAAGKDAAVICLVEAERAYDHEALGEHPMPISQLHPTAAEVACVAALVRIRHQFTSRYIRSASVISLCRNRYRHSWHLPVRLCGASSHPQSTQHVGMPLMGAPPKSAQKPLCGSQHARWVRLPAQAHKARQGRSGAEFPRG